MRNAIVNAGQRLGLPSREVLAAAAHRSGGRVGHAASDTANRRGAACADDLRVIGRCLAVLMVATSVLAFNASELWPQLFAH